MSARARSPLWLVCAALAVACGEAPTQGLDDPTEPADAGTPLDARPSSPDAGLWPDAAARPDAARPDATARPDTGPADAGVVDLLERLRAVPGLEVAELPARLPGTRAFAMTLEQPQDHQGLLRTPVIPQRLILIHRDEDAPTVLFSTGYGLFEDPLLFTELEVEPTLVLGANQLTVEHRFFGESIARPADWSKLTVAQAAADAHHIVTALSAVYRGPWVGTGVSKGGMTTIFHHHFYPDDLAAAVPYVAPISFGMDDPRYEPWLDAIGPADGACRERVRDLALELIERRAELAAHYARTVPGTGRLSTAALEAIVTYPAFGFDWGFWQQLGSRVECANLPPRDGPVELLALYFPLDLAYALDPYAFDPELSPYGYQVQNELGSQSISYEHLYPAVLSVDYEAVPTPTFTPPPWGSEPFFDPLPMREIDRALRTRARRVLAVYGAWDPWTAGRITVDEANDSTVITVPELNHGAELFYLPEAQREAAYDRIRAWAGRPRLRGGEGAGTKRWEHREDGHARIVAQVLAHERRARAWVRAQSRAR